MKKIVKLIILIAVAVVVVTGGVVYAQMPLRVEVQPVSLSTAVLTFTEQGTYDYTSRVEVLPILSGEILELMVDEGDFINAGDVIATINVSDYEFQIEQLESTIAGYRAQIANLSLQEQRERESSVTTIEGLKGQLKTIEAEQQKNRDNKESLEAQIAIQERIVTNGSDLLNDSYFNLRDAQRNARDLGTDEYINWTRQEHHAAQVAYNQARLVLEQLKAGEVPDSIFNSQREAIESQIEAIGAQMGKSYSAGMQQYYNAQIEYARTAIAQIESMAGKAEITAPVSGTLSKLHVKYNQQAFPGQPVAVIGENAEVEVFVPIREIDGVSLGDKVELILDRRLGETVMAGTVTKIEREAVAKLSALGIEERKVRILVRPEGVGLHIGYDMDVRFTVYRAENVVIIPKTAVFEKDGRHMVWLLEDGIAAVRIVEKGIETREGYIIDSGLNENDAVIIDANNSALSEGKKAADQ